MLQQSAQAKRLYIRFTIARYNYMFLKVDLIDFPSAAICQNSQKKKRTWTCLVDPISWYSVIVIIFCDYWPRCFRFISHFLTSWLAPFLRTAGAKSTVGVAPTFSWSSSLEQLSALPKLAKTRAGSIPRWTMPWPIIGDVKRNILHH